LIPQGLGLGLDLVTCVLGLGLGLGSQVLVNITATNPQSMAQTGPITIHCAAASSQRNSWTANSLI